MKKRIKGFTLIELLAVIIVLAIILLIIMPIVINLINDARKGAFEATARGLVKTVENQYMKKHLREEALAMDYFFEDWEQVAGDPLEFSGRGPKEGTIRVYDDGDIEMAIHDEQWCVTKDRENRDINPAVSYDGDCGLEGEEAVGFSCDNNGYPCLLETAFGSQLNDGFLVPVSQISDPGGVSMIINELEYSIIRTAAELKDVELDMEANYILMADINLNGNSFEPIGKGPSASQRGFEGYFEGNGYRVYNGYIDEGTDDFVGLFGEIWDGRIANLGVEFSSVEASDYVGALAGAAYDAEIFNCYATSSIIGRDTLGGLMGEAWNMDVSNSYATGSINGRWDLGGLLGEATLTQLSYSFATGNVTNSNEEGSRAGGLVGRVSSNSSILNSYSTGNVIGWWNVGGLLGGVEQNSVVDQVYATGSATGNHYNTGGLIGIIWGGDIANSYYNVDNSDYTDDDGRGLPRNTSDMTYPHNSANTYIDWDFVTVWSFGN